MGQAAIAVVVWLGLSTCSSRSQVPHPVNRDASARSLPPASRPLRVAPAAAPVTPPATVPASAPASPWIKDAAAARLARRRLAGCGLGIDVPREDEARLFQRFEVRDGDDHLDVRHTSWGQGIDAEGDSIEELRRVYISTSGCSSVSLYAEQGGHDSADGMFRPRSRRRPLPSAAEREALVAMGGYRIGDTVPVRRGRGWRVPTFDEPAPGPRLPKPTTYRVQRWVFRGPVAVAGPPVPGAPPAHKLATRLLLTRDALYKLIPTRTVPPLAAAHRLGRYEIFVRHRGGRYGGADVFIRETGSPAHRLLLPEGAACRGQLTWLGARGDLALVRIGFEHPVLQEQWSACLALLDLGATRVYTIGLPGDACRLGPTDDHAAMFTAGADSSGLWARCAPGGPASRSKRMLLGWKAIEEAAAQLRTR